MQFLHVCYDNKNEIFDINKTSDIYRICSHFLSDDDLLEIECAFNSTETPLTDDLEQKMDMAIMDKADASVVCSKMALEIILGSEAKYSGSALSEQIAVEQAGEAYNKIKNEVIAKMEANGFEVYRNKNNSVYFERNNVKVRLSNHLLGSDYSGRPQTGGVDVDFVFDRHCEFEADDIVGDIEFEIEQL